MLLDLNVKVVGIRVLWIKQCYPCRQNLDNIPSSFLF